MRWALALVGFIYGRVPGAILGYLFGRWLDTATRRQRSGRIPATSLPIEIFEDLVILTMSIARADGHLDRREIRTIKAFFAAQLGFGGQQMRWLQDALKNERKHPGSWQNAARRLRSSLSSSDLQIMLRLLMLVAAADGRLDPAEQQLLGQIAASWDLPLPSFSAGPRQQQGKGRDWALDILGLDNNADRDQIERQYKKLIREKHPDRFEHLGEEFARSAHDQFVEIQEAYRILNEAA